MEYGTLTRDISLQKFSVKKKMKGGLEFCHAI